MTHSTFVTMRNARQDDRRLTLEALRPTIDHGLHRFHSLLRIDHVVKRSVHPPTGFDGIEAGDDEVELGVE